MGGGRDAESRSTSVEEELTHQILCRPATVIGGGGGGGVCHSRLIEDEGAATFWTICRGLQYWDLYYSNLMWTHGVLQFKFFSALFP